ncbi:DUF4252 domain-containing protein [Sphingobacterium litopenaei]|nr:DUF4252 domain-containing protein [Sphingobacterium litopenaei]
MIKRGSNMEFAKKSDFSNDAEIVSINVPRILMKSFIIGKMKELKEDDPALAMAIKKIKKIKFMAVSGATTTNLSDKFNSYLAKNNFEELMSLYSEGARITINTKMKGDKVKNIMLGIKDSEDHVFVDIKSDLDINELNRLIEEYEDKKEQNASIVQ